MSVLERDVRIRDMCIRETFVLGQYLRLPATISDAPCWQMLWYLFLILNTAFVVLLGMIFFGKMSLNMLIFHLY